MNKFKKSKRVKILVVSSVIMIGLVGVNIAHSFKSNAESVDNSSKSLTAKERLMTYRDEVQSKLYGENYEVNLDEEVRVVITLEEKALADTNKVSKYTSKLKNIEKEIIKEQNDIIDEVEELTDNKVVNQTGYLVNSFSIDATRREIKEIAKIEGIESVAEAITYKPYMDSAIVEGNVVAQLESPEYGYTGEGVVIAVIDAGVNYEHQDMALDVDVKTKFTEEEWKNKIELLGYGKYMSDKVPFGYNYVTGENSCLNSYGEHGYHVSSIAAANGQINGVAKNAQVIGLNIFGDKGYATSDDIVAAIEDAVKLGADVINLSLGCDIPVVSNDYEQIAIDNATKEGVICCVAAGNSATSSSDSGPKNLLNLKDTAMVGSLATSDTSLAVASAENIELSDNNQEFNRADKEIKMSKFSSWGPTNELGIKPEITAPGGGIKAACEYENEYKVLNGTSMASPYIAGSQAIMLNAIKERGLDLNGEELARFLKNSLMNTADVIIDKTTNNPYPVRYQGAGLVDVYGAVDNEVLVTYNDEAKVELGEINGSTTFNLVIKNYGKETCTYKLDNTQIYVDYTDNPKWQYGIRPVDGAYISYSKNDIVVEAGQGIEISATLNIPDNYENNSYVEAFILLKGDGNQDIGLPLLGFYGDWDSEPIIDKTLYDEEKSVINKNLLYEKNKIGSYLALINENGIEKAGLNFKKVVQNISELQENSEPVEAVPSTNFDLVHLEENIEEDIRYDGFIAEFSIKVQEDGYYTFKLDNIPLSEITIKQAYDKKYGEHDNIVDIKGMGNLSKEVILLTGREYRLKLHILKSGLMHIKQGKIRFYKSKGENTYITEQIYDSNLIAFSPNGDNINDKVAPSLVMLRCAREVDVNVLNCEKEVVRTIANVKDVAKTTFRLDGYAFDGLVGRPHESLLYNNIENTYVLWDGTLYNKQTGKYEYAKEDLYYIQVVAKRTENSKPYVVEMPIRIDIVEPQIEELNVSKVKDDVLLEFRANDNYSLKGNYYIDIEENTDKGIVTYTYDKKYLETDINDNGNYVLNLGNVDIRKITLLVEDMAGNQVFKQFDVNTDEIHVDEDMTHVDVDLTDKDNISEDEDINIDKDNQLEVDILEGSYKLKSNPFYEKDSVNIKEEIVLVENKPNGGYVFEFKVSGHNIENLEEVLNITAEAETSEDRYGPKSVPINVTYKDNETFLVEMKEVKGVAFLYVEWESNESKKCSKIFNMTTSKVKYKQMCDSYVIGIESNLDDISIIDETMLNEDGTFLLKGKISEIPTSLKINEQEVEVNPTTLEYSLNVPINKGLNYIVIEATIDGIKYSRGRKLNYEEIIISLDESITTVDGVINTDKEFFNLEGIIKSYSTVCQIKINGSKVYTASDYLMTSGDKPFEKEFNYVVKLNKGTNMIKLEIKTGSLETKEKIIMVNYN